MLITLLFAEKLPDAEYCLQSELLLAHSIYKAMHPPLSLSFSLMMLPGVTLSGNAVIAHNSRVKPRVWRPKCGQNATLTYRGRGEAEAQA